MAEKRDITRKKKRLKMRFGVDAPTRVAFTEDLSNHGLFIITGNPENPGTLLKIEIYLPDETIVRAEGRVRWGKKVPAQLMRLASKGGMGVRLSSFAAGEAEYRQLVAELRH
ncbi:MAG TPA: PilZ domain-containing protein [Malonomonas sp.]